MVAYLKVALPLPVGPARLGVVAVGFPTTKPVLAAKEILERDNKSRMQHFKNACVLYTIFSVDILLSSYIRDYS